MKILVFLFLLLFTNATSFFAAPMKGDVDGDGRLTSADATFIARYLAGHFDHIPDHISHTEEWQWAADTTCAGFVSAASLTRFAQMLTGIVETLCAEEICTECSIELYSTLGDLPVGAMVYLRENGVAVPFIVVQQGRPEGLPASGNLNRPLRPEGNAFANNNTPVTAYANWNNTTVLMRERVLNPMRMGDASNLRNVFQHSEVFRWLNNTYFNTLDASVRNEIINTTIPVINCGTFHTLHTSGNQSLGIGSITQRVFITNMNARVWIPHAAEIGVPWGTENSNHTLASHAFPNALSVLHWLPGAGTTWQQWNNTIRFTHFPFGHGTNPSRAIADTASAIRVALCDNGTPRTWWTRCPGNQISGGSPWGVAVGINGEGHLHRINNDAWVRPTMSFPSTLSLSALE